MLNRTLIKMGSTTNNIELNATSTGMMQRSHPKSFFVRFCKDSHLEEWLFPFDGTKPCLKEVRDCHKSYWKTLFEVSVIQVLVFGKDEFLAEIIKDSDLEHSEIP